MEGVKAPTIRTRMDVCSGMPQSPACMQCFAAVPTRRALWWGVAQPPAYVLHITTVLESPPTSNRSCTGIFVTNLDPKTSPQQLETVTVLQWRSCGLGTTPTAPSTYAVTNVLGVT